MPRAGKIEYEDMIQEVVAAGALAFPDRKNLYPDAGEDAVGMVEKVKGRTPTAARPGPGRQRPARRWGRAGAAP